MLDPIHPIHSAILEILCRKPLSTAELKNTLDARGITVSTPNLYRIVSHLITAQVLVKQRGKLSLHRLWVSEFLQFAETLGEWSRHSEESVDLPEKEGEQRVYRADSLAGLDPLWNHLLLQITEKAENKVFEEYDAHAWYLLATPDSEAAVYRAIARNGFTVRLGIGGKTTLDLHAVKALESNKEISVCSAAVTPFPSDGYIAVACGSYSIELVLPEILRRQFAIFFQNVQSMADFEPERFADVFRMKCPCSLTVRKSQKHAETLREAMGTMWK
ncbi:hypothetical protein A3C37_04030 [Candidatus Peribacteria bacterium RIFCSPHIGHO2_02_FULL_53_20]|nr:MAG: hypothetical protein A3C37_04030 [Candidatus Peribacteria bacterium RIFCSPHIGHO2_02_FULL_53_20]OGJ67577.1 MAG: hypothetical protein A3B61_03200 [Candidatus Peribacteria bacterium RIFCSPLOWO2_01_FULL_53_10]